MNSARNRKRRLNSLHTIQPLEPRLLMAAISWDGGGDGVNWTSAANWSTDSLPGAADDVTIDVAGSPTIQLNSGTQTINSLVCNENFSMGFATLDLASASSINANFSQSAGTLTGSGNLTINGTLTWSAGAHTGTGRTIVPATQTLNISGGQLARVLDLSGTANITGFNFTFGNASSANATFNVLAGAVLNLTTNGSVGANGGTAHALNNSGTINRSGAGTTNFSSSIVAWTNNGTINVDAGTLSVGGTIVNNGAIAVDAGATVSLERNGTHNPGSTFSGSGNASFGIGSTHTFPAGTFSLGGLVTISATVSFDDDLTLSGLSLGGNLGGSGDVTVNGPISWGFGTMSGSGATTLVAGQTMTIGSGAGKQLARRLDIAGTVDYVGSNFSLGNGTGANATINILSTGVFNCTTNQDFSRNGGTAHAINNSGTINRSGVGITSISSTAVTLTNNNAINITAGIMDVGLFVNNGTVTTASGASLRFNNDSTFNPGSTLAGPGAVVFGLGTHDFVSGSYGIAGPMTLGGGTITGAGELSLGAGGTWSSGFMRGTGKTIVPFGQALTMTSGAAKSLVRTLDVAGTLDFTGDQFLFGDATTNVGTLNILSAGVMNLVVNQSMSRNGTAFHAINNAGTINRSGAGTTTITSGINFNNNALVNANAGTLSINTSNVAAPGFLTGGRYVVVPGATLDFASLPQLAADIEIHGAGSVPDLGSLQVNRGRIGLEDGADLTMTPLGGTYTQHGILDLSPDSVFTVNGNMIFAGTSQPIIRTEIASATSFGKVVVTGNLDLNSPDSTSRFDPDLVGGFDPTSGSTFNVITAAEIPSGFDSFFGGVTPSNLILLLTRPNAQTVAVEIGTGTPPPAPQILSTVFDFETREALVFTFDQDVSAFLSRKDYQLQNLTTSQTIPQSTGLLSYNAASNQATLLLTNQLADGKYRLTIQASDIANAAGVPATGGITFDFHVLKGDANRDQRVNVNDFTILASNFGTSGRVFSEGDFNYDGIVNVNDFTLLAARFGVILGGAEISGVRRGGTAPFADRLIDLLA